MDTADGIFSPLTSAWMIVNIALCCLILYIFIYYLSKEEDAFLLIANLGWLAVAFGVLGIIAVGGGSVNYQAHASLGEIHDLDLSNKANENTLLQMQMFLNKLSGDPIGFSAFNMFVIDRPTILTVLGMVLTYFIVLAQFQPILDSSSAGAGLMNCTGTGPNVP
ncbi:uncharacterized protein LOC106177390 [Lingula anatina]|uniref:Uncharacterized protein LOC106177390 n=1 Tax=Lingula anatina TaxID=7574 RepID=A0A1S3JYW0_LINAN|nr:uncharacterized protein LOC106177390 [Lingula anatina]|eukprot:XP_013415600.1 uncharacterized protein LOC106177390 [Lingula anatina]